MKQLENLHLDTDDNCSRETSIEHTFSPGSPDTNNIFGDPLISTRVGNEYQVEIPPIMAESECLKQSIDSTESKVQDNYYSFQSRLPIPISWIQDEDKNIEDEGLESLANRDKGIDRSESAESRNGKNYPNVSKTKVSIGLDLDVEEEARTKSSKSKLAENLNQLHRTKSCYPVPALSNKPWTDAEVDSFVFGIYVFGKDFVQIKRFMENKYMGEILLFYYGKFYKSAAYLRWSDSRKSKRKKCTIGRKIFTGRRQQELVSRLFPHVPEEYQNILLESYKSFVEWRTSLEEYVSSLKSIVSTRVLVEAVAICKGEKDLTILSTEPRKNKHEFLVCPKLPCAQACSSLTTNDIVKVLTGGFRLSKTRYNDIFWEAVWPRLLAKGWHSEQPKTQAYISSKYNLVFLMPGVEKFSRKKLVKGEHYFDSVSDVLSKIAHEPKFIELGAEDSSVGSQNEQVGWVPLPDDASDQDDTLARKRHCYLKPRVSACDHNNMKFTVIDTSLLCERKQAKLSELKSLPVESTLNSEKTNLSREKGIGSQERLSEIDTTQTTFHDAKPKLVKTITVVDTSLVHRGKPSKMRELRYLTAEVKNGFETTGPLLTEEDSLSSHSRLGDAIDVPLNGKWSKANFHNPPDRNQVATENSTDTADKMVEQHQDQNTSISAEKHPKRTVLHQPHWRKKSGKSNCTGPLVKRRRLTACVKAETNNHSKKYSKSLGFKQTGQPVTVTMNSSDADKRVISQVGTEEKLSSISSPVEDIPLKENKVWVQRGKRLHVQVSRGTNEKKHKKQALDDPNQTKGPVLNVKNEVSSQGININGSCFSSHEKRRSSNELRTIPDACIPHQHHNIINRRQSTRKRPLTVKALEALENGFLTDHMWQKGREDHAQEDLCSSPSHKSRRRVKICSNHSAHVTCIEAAKENLRVNEACNIKGCITSQLQNYV